MSEDKRKTPRIRRAIALQYINPIMCKWSAGMVRDVSEGGISFTSDWKFASGEIITVRIKLPSHPLDWIELHAKIIHVQELGFELYFLRTAFEDMMEPDKELLHQYLTVVLNQKGGKV